MNKQNLKIEKCSMKWQPNSKGPWSKCVNDASPQQLALGFRLCDTHAARYVHKTDDAEESV